MNGTDFPHLTPENHRITSPVSTAYNCVAWASGDATRGRRPGVYWPIPVGSYGPEVQESAFRWLDFESCAEGRPESGWGKVALYASGSFYTHAAATPFGFLDQQTRQPGRY